MAPVALHEPVTPTPCGTLLIAKTDRIEKRQRRDARQFSSIHE
jgi:hypothetical protein